MSMKTSNFIFLFASALLLASSGTEGICTGPARKPIGNDNCDRVTPSELANAKNDFDKCRACALYNDGRNDQVPCVYANGGKKGKKCWPEDEAISKEYKITTCAFECGVWSVAEPTGCETKCGLPEGSGINGAVTCSKTTNQLDCPADEKPSETLCPATDACDNNGNPITATTGATTTVTDSNGNPITATTDDVEEENSVGGESDNSDGGDSGGIAALVVITILIVLGVGGFLVYWFVFKKRVGAKAKAKPKPAPDVEMAPEFDPSALDITLSKRTTSMTARRVSKPTLVSVNGEDVDSYEQSESDDTIDEEDVEEPPAQPPAAQKPKPPAPKPKPPPPKNDTSD